MFHTVSQKCIDRWNELCFLCFFFKMFTSSSQSRLRRSCVSDPCLLRFQSADCDNESPPSGRDEEASWRFSQVWDRIPFFLAFRSIQFTFLTTFISVHVSASFPSVSPEHLINYQIQSDDSTNVELNIWFAYVNNRRAETIPCVTSGGACQNKAYPSPLHIVPAFVMLRYQAPIQNDCAFKLKNAR